MRDFKSNEDLFEALSDLIGRIERQGAFDAAKQLRKGFSCLNGLTDGWALLMESLERTTADNREVIGKQEMSELGEMLKVVRKVVYRK